MRKFLALLVLGACALGVTQAFADAVDWGVVPLQIRTQTTSGDPFDQGYIDSSTATLGLKATIDTTTAFTLPMQYLTADSLSNIYVILEAVNNFAASESVYIAIEASGNGNTGWASTNIATCGTCRAGGFSAAGSIVPGTSANGGALWFNGKASTTSGIVAAAALSTVTSNLYGGHWLKPFLRLKILSTIATDDVVNTYRVKVLYQKVKVNLQ